MSDRFLLAAAPRDGRATLEGDEARHLARVLRARVGDAVTVFDGRGRSWRAVVSAIGRDRVEIDLAEPLPSPPPPARAVTIAVALPKGERQKWLVEKLTELGVAGLVPLVTARGVAEATDSAVARLERAAAEACKQCGRDTLMEIGTPRTIAALLAGASAPILLADPRGTMLDAAPPGPEVLVLVGPEGGFTDEETAAAVAAGARRVALARHVLRVETAAIAAAARLA